MKNILLFETWWKMEQKFNLTCFFKNFFLLEKNPQQSPCKFNFTVSSSHSLISQPFNSSTKHLARIFFPSKVKTEKNFTLTQKPKLKLRDRKISISKCYEIVFLLFLTFIFIPNRNRQKRDLNVILRDTKKQDPKFEYFRERDFGTKEIFLIKFMGILSLTLRNARKCQAWHWNGIIIKEKRTRDKRKACMVTFTAASA